MDVSREVYEDMVKKGLIDPTAAVSKPSKYHNEACWVDGHRFASKREAKRYGELRLLEAAGKIMALELQPRFLLVVNGVLVCTYVGDFQYTDAEAKTVVEDAKGVRTHAYNIKRRLMEAVHGITISEV
jgi:allantoicase